MAAHRQGSVAHASAHPAVRRRFRRVGETRCIQAAGGLGPLRPDPQQLLDLPDGFELSVVSRVGTAMSDGFKVPAAHDGMARSMLPSHTPFDGDLVFAVSTGARPLDDPIAGQTPLGHAAATCLARAVARGVYLAEAAANDVFPTWQARFGQG